MEWSLLVDTDSLYLETRGRFGPQARLDYVSLPLNAAQNLHDISAFKEKLSVVLRHGREWRSFVEFMKKSGYKTIITDRGMELISLSSQVIRLVNEGQGVVLASAGSYISFLVKQVLDLGGQAKIVTFGEFEGESIQSLLAGSGTQLAIVNKDWLWNNRRT
jgi:hypothetical protein